jgi:uncharacterized glyoxalase superfamily protein PhnB
MTRCQRALTTEMAKGHDVSMDTTTDDPDALHDRVVKARAEITAGLHETDYGSRDFSARDIEGNHWSFSTYRGEPRRSPD